MLRRGLETGNENVPTYLASPITNARYVIEAKGEPQDASFEGESLSRVSGSGAQVSLIRQCTWVMPPLQVPAQPRPGQRGEVGVIAGEHGLKSRLRRLIGRSPSEV
jgi:hypothetical protein